MVANVVSVSAVNLYPEHTTKVCTKPEVTKHIVYAYEELDEDGIVDLLLYSAAAEDTELWLYPINGTDDAIKVTPTDECAKELFKNYVTTTTDSAYNPADIPSKACEYLNGLGDVQKILVIDMELRNGVIIDSTQGYTYAMMTELIANNPEILFVGNCNYVLDGAPSNHDFFELSELGYEECSYANYDRIAGKLRIPNGKIDDNVVVVARAEKSDLLYISGYLASITNAQKYAEKSKIKGVSLGYNHLNIAKNKSPKNMAFTMFTVDDSIGDMATEAFEVVVKNAEFVDVYYKSSPGCGTVGAKITYDKSQDDEIRNLYAPVEKPSVDVEEKNSGIVKEETVGGVQNHTSSESSDNSPGILSKIGSIILSVIRFLLGLILVVLYLGILAFIGLMIFNKKFRANALSKIYSTKYGPKIQDTVNKAVSYINSLFFERKRIKAAANIDGKYAFISHASVDYNTPGSIITALIEELKKHGVDCWTSEDGIKTGEDYNEILPLAIDNCEMMLFFISPASINSTEVESEIIAAKRLRKKLIPIQISDFDLFANSKWQHILAQYQVTKLLSAEPAQITEMAKHIKTVFDKK